eukprot:3460882-Prymnesium_polylepis.1
MQTPLLSADTIRASTKGSNRGVSASGLREGEAECDRRGWHGGRARACASGTARLTSACGNRSASFASRTSRGARPSMRAETACKSTPGCDLSASAAAAGSSS